MRTKKRNQSRFERLQEKYKDYTFEELLEAIMPYFN